MKIFKINKKDNVAIALENLKQGEKAEDLTVLEDVSMGHKIAITDIKQGEKVIKYGYPIGSASEDIKKGSHIHTHNLKSDVAGKLNYTYNPDFTEIKKTEPKTFMGYLRENGDVGIRNEVWIIPTVGCVNSVVKAIENGSKQYKTENIDGIYSYNHPYGCSQLGDDMENTLKYLSGLINHPNAGAVLVVGLGCENGNISELKKYLGDVDTYRVKFLIAQNEENEIEKGIELVKELCAYADKFKRTLQDTSKLKIGLKCGGSDGFSGITANSLVGSFSDMLISKGGSTVLTEVPEMFGAETILMNRCRTKELFNKTVDLINSFKEYFIKYGEKTDENPSPGNKAGGITTIADKSLGCVQKGGSAVVEDVLLYAEPIKKQGLSLLQAPGNDLVASNALAVSGCQLVLFTTGRGTPFGCPVPTVKIASNTSLYNKKKSWIDFNAGKLLDGEDIKDEFFDFVLGICSGKKTKSELLDKTELAIFKDGVTL